MIAVSTVSHPSPECPLSTFECPPPPPNGTTHAITCALRRLVPLHPHPHSLDSPGHHHSCTIPHTYPTTPACAPAHMCMQAVMSVCTCVLMHSCVHPTTMMQQQWCHTNSGTTALLPSLDAHPHPRLLPLGNLASPIIPTPIFSLSPPSPSPTSSLATQPPLYHHHHHHATKTTSG